ncbi:MAG: asparagine synthase (glutamine-hydrolyzing) [Desulfobacterales bacterium]|nr:asparagine synthase (glutamine-hydrolyzing) [Desulfobacterales bacterium]
MCGIFGIITHNSIDPSLSIQAKRFLKHRGPDTDGDFYTCLNNQSQLLFVHTRLSIIDLKEGGQPMWDAENRWVIVFNGEIYNYIELKQALQQEGCTFKTNSDTEVLITAIAHWGAEKAIPRLNGMFAFASYSKETDELIIARDRFGIKPLYLIENTSSVIFCSELGTLIRLGLTSKKISKAGLELYLSQYSLPAPWSMIDGVEKVRPAYFIRIKNGKRTDIRYWYPRWQVSIADYDQAISGFNHHMIQAMERQFRSDVPVGIALSGGLDSCGLLAYSVQELYKKPACFTLSFREKSFDESCLAQEMALFSNVELNNKCIEPKHLFDHMRFVLSTYGEPIGDWGVGLVAFVSYLAHHNYKVLLVGSGGDELFAGYPTIQAYYYANWFRTFPECFRHMLKNIRKLVPESDKNMSLSFKLHRFLYGADFEPFLGHLKYKEIFNDEERKSILGYEPIFGLNELLKNIDCLENASGAERLLWIDLNTFMQSNVLAGFDAASMAYGIEMRVPFLDNDFYDFSLSIAPGIKFSKITTKPLIRKALRSRVPRTILKAPKRGFVYPVDQWFRTELLNEVEQLFTPKYIKQLGLNSDIILKYWHEHRDGKKNRGRQISALLSLIIWYQAMFD